jgi:AcrR family transcriptional regulator
MNARTTTEPPTGGEVQAGRMPYVSALRSQQARATQRTIVAAATELFLRQGYSATTIDAIAERAGVGRKTVFSSVGGKGALLTLAWDRALVGDDEPVPMAERPAVQAMLAESDPVRLIRMWVDLQLDVGGRAAPLGAVILAAADVDAEASALLDVVRRESMVGATAFVRHLAGIGGLRADLDVERAADSCWALLNSLLLPLLMEGRRWSRHDYGDWLVRIVSATLLEPTVASRGDAQGAGVRIEHDPDERCYRALVGDRRLGRLRYDRGERIVILIRTDVEPGADTSAGADGVADALVRHALDDVRSDGANQVVPLCPYVTWWLDRHPEYRSLVFDATLGPPDPAEW